MRVKPVWVTVRRLEETSQLRTVQRGGGYVINVSGSRSHVHKAGCVTVGWMNPKKRGGVYHALTLEEALEWAGERSIECSPCRICLPTLTYRPRPEKLTKHMQRLKN